MKEALWLLGAVILGLVIVVVTVTAVLYLERPAQAVQHACVTTAAARG